MRDEILRGVAFLQSSKAISSEVSEEFLSAVKNECYLRDHGSSAHFCSFFVPFCRSKKSVFMGYHRKAQDWTPPGGHVDLIDATLKSVVVREMQEELQYDLTGAEDRISLHTATIKPILGNAACSRHLDFWQLVHFDNEEQFTVDAREFAESQWIPISEASKYMKTHVDFFTRYY